MEWLNPYQLLAQKEQFGMRVAAPQGREVEDVPFLTCVFASAIKSTAATCEQTSPSPAIQLQWAHTTSPFSLTATHTFKGVSGSLCECFI